LRTSGIDSDIYYGSFTPMSRTLGHRSSTSVGQRRTAGFSTSRRSEPPSSTRWPARDEPKLVNYHNITPARLLEQWEPTVGFEVRLGRTQLERLAPESRWRWPTRRSTSQS